MIAERVARLLMAGGKCSGAYLSERVEGSERADGGVRSASLPSEQ